MGEKNYKRCFYVYSETAKCRLQRLPDAVIGGPNGLYIAQCRNEEEYT